MKAFQKQTLRHDTHKSRNADALGPSEKSVHASHNVKLCEKVKSFFASC